MTAGPRLSTLGPRRGGWITARRGVLGLAIVLLGVVGAVASAQRFGSAEGEDVAENAAYDGRFTFVRVKFDIAGGEGGWRRDIKWAHDYPRGERHFVRILDAVSLTGPRLDSTNVLTLADPELFRYPVAYLCEPGFWLISDEEAANLRAYLLKGGFIIFDDFVGNHWYQFEASLRRAFPEGRLVQLDASHPIFDSFYHIESLDFTHPNFPVTPQFYGLYEDNDESKRLMAIVNYNNDIGDYWEWSDEGFLPIELTNEAYKLGVNYVVYAMTH